MLKRVTKLLISLVVCAWDLLAHALLQVLGRPQPAQLVVLYYHAVRPEHRPQFAQQLDTLLELAHPIPLDHRPALTPKTRYAAVTFDDGFVNVLHNALPELRQRNIPFTVFVPTGCLGQHPSWVKDPAHASRSECVMTPGDLQTLAAEPLATIGSHSVSHPNFLSLDSGTANVELVQSKQRLEAILKRQVTLFSYPHGAHNDQLDSQALSVGYKLLFTISPARAVLNGNPSVMGRTAVNPSDWPIEFRLKLLGAYRWMAKRRKSESSQPNLEHTQWDADKGRAT